MNRLYLILLAAALMACTARGAQQTINVGTSANDGTGDTLRAAMQKVNANFGELYGGAAFTAPVPVAEGGTGQASYTNGQILIGNTAGNTLAKGTITGTANELTVTNGAGSIALSLPTALILTGKTITGGAFNSSTFTAPILGTPFSGTLTNCNGLPLTTGVTGILPIANIATGTPNGSKFVRDDGTLAVPGGSGTVTATAGALTLNAVVLGAGSTDTKASTLTATVVKAASGVLSSATAGTDYEVPLTIGAGLTRTSNTITVNLGANFTWTGTHTFGAFSATSLTATTFALGATTITATGTELNYASGVTSAIQAQLDAKSPLASPTFTGTPAAPTAASTSNSTAIATTAFVKSAVLQSEVTLTDGATITQTMVATQGEQNAKVTLGGNRTLAFASLAAGMRGNLRVIQDGTGSRTLTLPASSRVNGSATTVTLLTAAAAENILSWYSPDGTAIRWTNGTY